METAIGGWAAIGFGSWWAPMPTWVHPIISIPALIIMGCCIWATTQPDRGKDDDD